MPHALQYEEVTRPSELHPKLAELLQFWKVQRSGSKLPSRTHFNAHTLRPWLSHIAILDAIGEPPRFRIRLMGVNCVTIVGADNTGKWLDECVALKDREKLVELYSQCLETGQPYHSHAAYVKNFNRRLVERLHLPCANADGQPAAVVTAIYGTDKKLPWNSGMLHLA